MITAPYIARRLENTSDMVGGPDELRGLGFQNVMGYVTILRELNQMQVIEVFYIMEALSSMGGMYKYFVKHLLNDEVLADKFFEIDEEFNPTENNLLELTKNSIYHDEIDINNDDFKIDKESKLEKLYNAHFGKDLKNEDTSNVKGGIGSFLNKENMAKIYGFKKKLDYTFVNWIEINVPKMTNEEYGMLMTLIAKTREDGRK